MGEWTTVFEDEVEGRLVTVKVYKGEQDEEEDEGLPLRVTAAPISDDESELEQNGHVRMLAAMGRAITLEPASRDDLEEELIEIGFSAKAAALIVDQIPG